MAGDYRRIHRLLELITLIQSAPGWNVRRLAAHFDVAERSIYRDLGVLDQIGIPYYFDEQGKGYRIRGDYFLAPVELTLDEAIALIALTRHVGEKQQIPFMAPAAKAVAKLRGQLPSKLRAAVEKVDGHMDIHLAAAASADGIADVYEQVRCAIATRCALRCQYESLGAKDQPQRAQELFLFRPYRLLFSQRAWYAIGYHCGRNEVRKLKLQRFTCCEPTDEPYKIPDDFSLDDHLGQAWRMIRGSDRHAVELWFSPEFAETIADTHWHSTQRIDWQDDGSILFHCEVDGLDEIVWWILGMGPHCVVRKPKALVQRVRALTEQAAALYRPQTRTIDRQSAS